MHEVDIACQAITSRTTVIGMTAEISTMSMAMRRRKITGITGMIKRIAEDGTRNRPDITRATKIENGARPIGATIEVIAMNEIERAAAAAAAEGSMITIERIEMAVNDAIEIIGVAIQSIAITKNPNEIICHRWTQRFRTPAMCTHQHHLIITVAIIIQRLKVRAPHLFINIHLYREYFQ